MAISRFVKQSLTARLYLLVQEKLFLTFGLPRDMFIPVSGVAAFTTGFGLLATPLFRRISAIAVLGIFITAA
ncbi:hypothetical protein JSE7799_00692 [Jannaschia seosinensis]|uniref:Uncharacterized protein n=1 Tax=Jannaschia seosinensis TaxID=313367 RepID=A0A0M7B708_9RHOB|nr:hypothetical protein [Jannaschia seosinensis]CUH25360.1 hypothetical protein JSE7799_00692 [Jannaschia seosinensis]